MDDGLDSVDAAVITAVEGWGAGERGGREVCGTVGEVGCLEGGDGGRDRVGRMRW